MQRSNIVADVLYEQQGWTNIMFLVLYHQRFLVLYHQRWVVVTNCPMSGPACPILAQKLVRTKSIHFRLVELLKYKTLHTEAR